MNRFKLHMQASLAAAFALGLSVVSANAGIYTVEFGTTMVGRLLARCTQAAETNTIITNPADAVFTYTGDINWFVPGPQGGPNSAGAFVTYSGGSISGYSSPSLNANFLTVEGIYGRQPQQHR